MGYPAFFRHIGAKRESGRVRKINDHIRFDLHLLRREKHRIFALPGTLKSIPATILQSAFSFTAAVITSHFSSTAAHDNSGHFCPP